MNADEVEDGGEGLAADAPPFEGWCPIWQPRSGSWSDVEDTESETLRRLAEIRAAVAGQVKDADGIEAVRAALLRLFERFIIHVDQETKQGRLESIVRPEAIQTVEGEEMRPVLRPTALDTQIVGSATR